MTSKYHATWKHRKNVAKADSLRRAVGALCDRNFGLVRQVTATCDFRGHWQLFASTAQGHFRPVDGDRFTIHYAHNGSQRVSLEQSRIQRFLHWLQRHGSHPCRIVTGTKTGPDLLIRLADGSPAIVEVKGQNSHNQVRGLLAERYGHLLDKFQLFYASESRAGVWRIWRVRRSGFEPVEPEALRG